jgi:hypothetical protein
MRRSHSTSMLYQTDRAQTQHESKLHGAELEKWQAMSDETRQITARRLLKNRKQRNRYHDTKTSTNPKKVRTTPVKKRKVVILDDWSEVRHELDVADGELEEEDGDTVEVDTVGFDDDDDGDDTDDEKDVVDLGAYLSDDDAITGERTLGGGLRAPRTISSERMASDFRPFLNYSETLLALLVCGTDVQSRGDLQQLMDMIRDPRFDGSAIKITTAQGFSKLLKRILPLLEIYDNEVSNKVRVRKEGGSDGVDESIYEYRKVMLYLYIYIYIYTYIYIYI